MKFASKSAIESESSASPGSSASNGNSDELPPAENPWLSLRDVREPERSGVVGLDGGLLRDIEADLFAPLLSMLQISDGCTDKVVNNAAVSSLYALRDSVAAWKITRTRYISGLY